MLSSIIGTLVVQIGHLTFWKILNLFYQNLKMLHLLPILCFGLVKHVILPTYKQIVLVVGNIVRLNLQMMLLMEEKLFWKI